MYAADKPKQQVPEQAAQIFNELFRQLKAAFPALMTSIKDQSDLNELRRQWVLAFIENGITSIDQVNAGMKIAR
ncbi:replication protein P, partial [Yersinia enterocolitica]